jgi:hypothetical protein
LLYLTVVGYYIIPGSHLDALMMMRGAMWDVGNEYLYLAVEAEGEDDNFAPGAYLSNKEALETAKQHALDDLGKELVERMTGLR